MPKVKGKLALAAAVALVTGMVGFLTLGTAHAANPGQIPVTKAQCKNNGWKTFKNLDGSKMFKNQGECVSFVASHGQGGGSGYGGNTTINANANVNINIDHSDNNVINVVIQWIFGA